MDADEIKRARTKKKLIKLKMKHKARKLQNNKMVRDEILTKKKLYKKNNIIQKNVNKFKSLPKLDQLQQMQMKKVFKKQKMSLFSKFRRRKKKLLEEQSKQHEDFIDYEGLIKLQEKIYRHQREELTRKKVIYKAEISVEKAMRLNLPYDVVMIQEAHLRKLRETNEQINEIFFEGVFKERSRIMERTQLSQVRRQELEEKAQRDFALQRAEARGKIAELMVLLEQICGHPAEETSKPENDCGLEDITSSEDECGMDIKLEPITSSEDECDMDIKLEPITSSEDE